VGTMKTFDTWTSIYLCLQTFPKLLLLLVPKVTTRNLYPECIANLKLPIDAFYRESRSVVNIAKRNITTGLFGLLVKKKLLTTPAHLTSRPVFRGDRQGQSLVFYVVFW